jgi:lipopolysaccharide/colanic/teichoic acid biosynthesis glycosyltransferase
VNKKQLAYLPFKRTIDIVGSIVGLIFLSWLFLMLFLIQKITDPKAPVFYSHVRVGKNNKHFKMYKFRSMRIDSDTYFDIHPEEYKKFVENDFKFPAGNDPRVTKWGRILRRTSLDELPQLLNVLKGDMSIVGPRPITNPELENYKNNVDKLLSVRPGMLGLWQASGRSDIVYPERAELDLEYVDKIGFFYDWIIVFKSIAAVFERKGAF